MWLPGHLAVALILCLPLLLLYRRREGSYLLALAYIGFFSVLPDFLHFSNGLRMVSHSLLGAAVLTALVLVVLWRFFGTTPVLVAIAGVSVTAHLLADLYIGHIYPWFPFSTQYAQDNQFNTLFDLRLEIGLSLVATAILVLLYLSDRKGFDLGAAMPSQLGSMLVLTLPLAALSLAQMGYFGMQDILSDFTWSAAVLGLFFLAPTALLAAWAVAAYRRLRERATTEKRDSYSSKDS